MTATTLAPGATAPNPETAPATEPGAGAGGPDRTVLEPEPRRRRRKYAILLLLLGMVVMFAIVGAWYMTTRKPITVIPLPGVTQQTIPHYVFSVYGVTRPTGVAVSASGDRIYATDTDGDRVVKIFDAKGAAVGTIVPPETATGDHAPVYVAVDPVQGDVYVSDRIAGTIYVYNRDGVYRREFTPPADLAGWQPLGIGFDGKGNVYVTDVSSPFHRVHELTTDGKLVQTFGAQGTFNFPNGVAVDAAGYVYVTDSNAGRLLVFDQDGRQKSIVSRGQRGGELGLPRGIAIDDQGIVYVVDTSGYSVQLYKVLGTEDRQPPFVGNFGTAGSIDGTFAFPNGIAVDARSRVYITDSGNNRVQVWSY